MSTVKINNLVLAIGWTVLFASGCPQRNGSPHLNVIPPSAIESRTYDGGVDALYVGRPRNNLGDKFCWMPMGQAGMVITPLPEPRKAWYVNYDYHCTCGAHPWRAFCPMCEADRTGYSMGHLQPHGAVVARTFGNQEEVTDFNFEWRCLGEELRHAPDWP